MHKNKKKGYIVIIALVMLMAMTIVTERMIRAVFSGSIFAKTIEEREHAKMLALSGINVAIAQLNQQPYMLESKHNGIVPDSDTKQGPWSATRNFLKVVLPVLNKWQTFSFTHKKDGFEGELKICLTCEQGKININDIFDFNTKKMKDIPVVRFLKQLEMKGMQIAPGEVYKKIENFFVQRKTKLHDISELLEIDIFKTLDVFYKPSEEVGQAGVKQNKLREIALQDLFTVWNDNALDPLMLSVAWRGLCGMKIPTAEVNANDSDEFKYIVENFDPAMYQDNNKQAKLLEPFMEQGNSLQNFVQALFCKKFAPTVFSVLLYARVGSVLQRVLAVVRYVNIEKSSPGAAQKELKSDFRVLRVYWL